MGYVYIKQFAKGKLYHVVKRNVNDSYYEHEAARDLTKSEADKKCAQLNSTLPEDSDYYYEVEEQ